MILKTPYQCRPIRFLELVEHRGWRIKLYGIRYGGSRVEPDEILVESARRQVLDALPLPAVTDQRYGVGFLIIHQGQHNNWFLLDWWFEQEILKQKLFYSPPSDSTRIEPAEADLLACTWELAVHAFERQVWLDTVLTATEGPDLNAYLTQRFNGDV